MENTKKNNASLFNITLTLLTVGVICVALFFGYKIIMPLLISFFLAILLLPFVNFFKKRLRFNDVLSVSTSVILFVLLIGSVFFFLGKQVGSFYEDIPKIERNLDKHIHTVKKWVKDEFGINYYKQKKYLEEVQEGANGEKKRFVKFDFSLFAKTLLNILLVPIYTFFILIYRVRFLTFLKMKVEQVHHPKLNKILYEVKTVVRSYISGLGLQVIFVSVLTATGFYFVGIKYFIFLGVLTGILNLIPYLGIWVAATTSLVIALSESNNFSVILGVVIVNAVVQFLDNNVLVPNVVGSKVSLNALASILVVIVGGTLAGVAGMFVAIPTLAILKIVFDNIPELKPWGHLIGNKEKTKKSKKA